MWRTPPSTVFTGVRELEVVQVASHDNIGIRVDRQDTVHKVVDDLRLLEALYLRAERGRLETTEEGLVAAFGVEVVGNDKERVRRCT